MNVGEHVNAAQRLGNRSYLAGWEHVLFIPLASRFALRIGDKRRGLQGTAQLI